MYILNPFSFSLSLPLNTKKEVKYSRVEQSREKSAYKKKKAPHIYLSMLFYFFFFFFLLFCFVLFCFLLHLKKLRTRTPST